jgi:hypothetical protein
MPKLRRRGGRSEAEWWGMTQKRSQSNSSTSVLTELNEEELMCLCQQTET